MHNDQEDSKHASDHHQTPGHLMRALVLLAHRAHLGLREHAEPNQAGSKAQANDPVEYNGPRSASSG